MERLPGKEGDGIAAFIAREVGRWHFVVAGYSVCCLVHGCYPRLLLEIIDREGRVTVGAPIPAVSLLNIGIQ